MRLKKNNFITRLFAKEKPEAKFYNAQEFQLFPEDFDQHARDVVKTLQDNGYQAYIVGGGVRDQLLNLHPKDFDIVTNALPEQIKKLFNRALIIGRRFRLVHVYFSRYDFVEVATFRREQNFVSKQINSSVKKNGVVARNNLYGTLEEDAFRRDFTVNALYYDPTHQKITDFNEALQDVKNKVLRLIGKPAVRLREDPVRILRALRISNKISFKIDDLTLKAIPKFIPLLKDIAGGRLFDEYQKIFFHGDAVKNFKTLEEFGILPYLFPTLPVTLQNDKARAMILHALGNTDERYKADKTINPAFLISVFLWFNLQERQKELAKKHSKREAYSVAVRGILKEQTQVTNMPGYLVDFIEQVWGLQHQLERCNKNKALHYLKHPRYRAAYDFLSLRSELGEIKKSVPAWWDKLYLMPIEERVAFLEL